MSSALAEAQVIELFQIAFLDVLTRRLDPARFVLKGGANLRYFFASHRYSEDIDLDTDDLAAYLLAEKVEAILKSGPIPALLRSAGISIAEHSNPKLTETTQRWGVGLEAPGIAERVRTRVEFSARQGGGGEYALDVIPGEVVAPYALRPPSVQHYIGDTPTEQKVLALEGRNETQARDVFDLELLLRRRDLPRGRVDPGILERAIERAMELPYAAYRDHVVAFLEPDLAEIQDDRATWEQIQTFVAEKLEAAR